MARGTTPAERESKRKARTNAYLDSQLKRLREKLSNAKTTKEKQRIRASISSLKNRLGPKTRKDFIRSRNPLTKTSRGLRIRPKKEEKKSTIRKVKYTPTVGKVEEKPTNTSPKTDTPKTDTPINKTVKKTDAPKSEVKKPVKKTARQKFNEKFIKRKGGGIVKRGTVGARRAENREAARKRAQKAAELRIKKKKEKK